MKKLLKKVTILSALSVFALFVAQTSAHASTWWYLDQKKIPKSLIK